MKKINRFKSSQMAKGVLAAMMLWGATGTAMAVELDLDNPDLSVRFDNTVRYNAGWRMQSPKTDLIAPTSGIYATEEEFSKGSMVTDRVDLLSELDVIWKKDTGFRVSAAGWYDAVYGKTQANNTNFASGVYPSDVERYYAGPSGEILDAFVFTKFNLGDVPVNVKAGQHTVYWGETLFSLGDGVSYSQSYADLRKALATPGAEANEIFKPLDQVSFSASLTPEFEIMGQYFLNYKEDLFPLGGTYFSPADFLTYTGNTTIAPGVLVWNGVQDSKLKKHGDWGLGAKWRPEWLNGTIGMYYREFTPKNGGALVVTGNLPGVFAGTAPALIAGLYVDPDAPKTKLTGLSLGKQYWGISWGMDVTYRQDATLPAKTFGIIGPTIYTSGWAPTGDVATGTFNAIAYDGKRPFWDSAVFTTEFAWDTLINVKTNLQNFNGQATCSTGVALNPGAPNQGDYGCVTSSSYGLSFLFEPKWFQVLPGTDVSTPIFFSEGLHGNSSVAAIAQNHDMGSYSVGVTADVGAK